MQKRCDDRGVIQPLLGQDRRNRDGVGEIRFPGMPELPVMHLCPKGKRTPDQVGVGVGIVGADQVDQVVCVHLVRLIAVKPCPWAAISCRSSISSDMLSSSGLSCSAPISNAIASSSGSSTSI